LVECVVRVDDALATCFPNTRERLTSAAEGLKATSTQPGGLAQLPLGLGRSLGISLLECTEAMLDALLPLHPSGISLITSSGTAQDVDDEDVEDMPRASAKPRVGPSLPFFRMFAVKLSSGSHTLQVTVISVQDSYSSLLDRLGVHKVWQLLQSLKTVEVRRGICDAARDPPAAAAKATKQAISFLGCERQFASALERMLTTRLAVKLLGARSEQWAAWAHSAGCSGEPLDLPPSTVIVEDVDDFRRPLRALPGLTQLEKDAALAMGLRLVVKNSFIELVPDVQEGEEPASKCARRTRSCGAVLAHTQEREVWIDAAEEVARYPTAGPPPTRLAPPPEPQPPPTPTPTSARSPSPSWPSWHSAAAAAAAVPPAPALTPLAPPAPPAAAAATAQPMTAAASAAAFDEAVAAEAALLDAGKAGAAALAKACGAGGAATEGADEGGEGPRTTIMLRNLPMDLSRNALLRALDDAGFAGRYCFVYLPIDFTRRRGLGYALVSASTEPEAEALLARLDGLRPDADGEAWQASWSEPCRSISEHIDRYRNSPVMHPSMPDEYKPVVFSEGRRMEFPMPTRPIRPPRIRHLRTEPDPAQPS